MEHEETYLGQRFVVTTVQMSSGGWSFSVETAETGQGVPLVVVPKTTYPSEREAWRAGNSAAAGAIDRRRTTRGKP